MVHIQFKAPFYADARRLRENVHILAESRKWENGNQSELAEKQKQTSGMYRLCNVRR